MLHKIGANPQKIARMCTPFAGLAVAAVFASGLALAQSTMPNQGTPTSGSATGTTNSTTTNNPAASGATSGMSSSTPASSPASGALTDKVFAKKAIQGGLAEVQLGQLAQQKSSSDDVKKFGQQMVDDHTKLNEQMKPIAATLGVEAPTDVSSKDKQLMGKLQALSGDDFDKAYIRAMLKDHKQDDKDFQMEATNGQNQQVKDAATQGDQIIKQHLQMVTDLAKAHSVGVGKGM